MCLRGTRLQTKKLWFKQNINRNAKAILEINSLFMLIEQNISKFKLGLFKNYL